MSDKDYKDLTHAERVLKYMKENKAGITPMEAWRQLGIYRLSDAIWKLRNLKTHTIVTDTVEVHNRFDERCKVARYYLVEAQ
jgi:hypothetical protein